MDDILKNHYLEILGVEVADPSLELLERIVAAHLIRAPFENLSKLHRFRIDESESIPRLEDYLDGIERWNLGGTCYANNYHLYTLLDGLGFGIDLCGADMTNPDVHIVSKVRLKGREYLVDVGYGAPFFGPLPRDLDHKHVIDFGRCRYILHPQDDHGRSRLDMLRDGRPTHGYTVKPEPRVIDDFTEVIRDSYRSEAAFMNAVVAERFFPGRSVRIHNLALTETEASGATTSTELHDRAELIDAIGRHFDIPAEITRHAIDGLSLDADIYA